MYNDWRFVDADFIRSGEGVIWRAGFFKDVDENYTLPCNQLA